MSETTDKPQHDFIVLGGGCFWCIEAIFDRLRGVESVISGYTGGKIPKPTYREICSGLTGHAEVIKVIYNQDEISLEQLLDVFWHSHDPTTLNRQGNDVGTQYRSAIFYNSAEQRQVAEASKKEAEDSELYPDPIVTEIAPLGEFYPAEDYHQSYYELNGGQPYCQFVIRPKVAKFQERYRALLKVYP